MHLKAQKKKPEIRNLQIKNRADKRKGKKKRSLMDQRGN